MPACNQRCHPAISNNTIDVISHGNFDSTTSTLCDRSVYSYNPCLSR